ncbi:MAG: class I SAM-dependent methyltransferase [Nisaea sp.]|jgi:2-polyprenyl-3-methyl-5-hydroxy-6-metoxy-1,4-benzoquinol methylase|uniref:class I SAM-dependent methyltransferase n=1 Tax=Nisaea sp. TaxID=2024842 RepID=UPI001B1E4CCB|nr:class I SAM-dependent methyltransferase [Nisaea sp.]MBO6561361.1 class I SAM-dependent methyltransferase [Nisaea sp.]
MSANNEKAAADALASEAEAFDKRITERRQHGFVADLRRMQPSEYFYKSFWRHPHYADLYVGEMCRNYLKFFAEHVTPGARILDLGCGPGYFALELARAGYRVTAIDISEKSVATARAALAENPFRDGFGSLEYHVGSYDLALEFGSFDGVLASGFLHHIPEIDEAVEVVARCLVDDGILVWHEPVHSGWTRTDAAFVATIRALLAASGLWYEPNLPDGLDGPGLLALTDDIQQEYILERDPNEADGQSPNDLSLDGPEIVRSVSAAFDIVHTQPSYSFVYRLMGGMRGDQEQLNRLASLLALIDRTYVDAGILNPNYFYGVARKRAVKDNC